MITEVCILSGPKDMDQLMHAFDVFETSKRLAIPEWIKITHEKRMTIPKAKAMVEGFKKIYEEADRNVVAIFIPGDQRSAFIDKNVASCSTGEKWFVLKDFLRNYDITVP